MSLTVASHYARMFIKGLSALIVIYAFALFFKTPIKSALELVFPPKDPPNPIYGQLEPLEFIAQPITGEVESFELNTVDGKFPKDLPKKMTVYKFVQPFLSFNAGKNAQDAAMALGFSDLEIVSDYKSDKFIWKDINNGATLQTDLLTQSIDLTTPLQNISSYYELGSINEEKFVKTAEELFQSLNKFKDPLYLKGDRKNIMGRFVGERVVEASTPVEAQLYLADYFRKIEDFPILGPNPKQGLIRIIIGSPAVLNQKLINPLVQIYEWGIEETSEASYPIIPVQLAWQNVAKGSGVIANVTPNNKSPFEVYKKTDVGKVTIEKVYLAYYDNIRPQTYLQPIYVFEGRYASQLGAKGEITIYYPAIDGTFVKGTEPDDSGVKKDPVK